MRVLVTGGTGRVGSMLLPELLRRGADVRVLARSASADSRLPSTVEIAVGDLLDPVSVAQAPRGVDKPFLLNAVAADELTQALIAYGVAKRLQIRSSTSQCSRWIPSRLRIEDEREFAKNVKVVTAFEPVTCIGLGVRRDEPQRRHHKATVDQNPVDEVGVADLLPYLLQPLC
jgi:hypothetical protein